VFFLFFEGSDFITITLCDAVGTDFWENPPTPPVPAIQGVPVEAPEVAPEPPEIPQLYPPLMSTELREAELYDRFLSNKKPPTPTYQTISRIVRAQSAVEEHIQAALVHDGFDALGVYLNRHHIRFFLFYYKGRALSVDTYEDYLSDITRLGTRGSPAYQRVINAIQNSDLFL
jgi:hypothetical protein